MARTYEQYDRQVFDYCKEGLAHFRFHPDGLPDRDTLLPLACFDSGSEHLQSAQRRYSQIIHHAAWLGFWNALQLPGVAKCLLDNTEGCSDEEKEFMEKWKAKDKAEITAELERLKRIVSLKPDRKKWLTQRKSILEQL